MMTTTRLHSYGRLSLFLLAALVVLFVFRSPALASTSGATVIGVQVSDYNSGACGPNTGTAQKTPDSTSGGDSSYAYDTGGTDFNCAKIYLDEGTLPSSLDTRYCVTAIKQTTMPGSEVCTPWASAGGGSSSWARDGSNGDIDGVRMTVEHQALAAGTTITDIGLGWQQAKNASTCSSNVGVTTYAAGGSVWSGWIVDGTNGDSNCVKIYLTATVGVTPTVSLSASPTTLALGAATTLTWSSTNATSCTATAGTGFSTGSATSGSDSATPTSTGTKTYTVSCTGTGGTATASRTITVTSSATPTATLSASPTSVSSGSSSTLTWTSTNASSCTGTGFSTGSATSGSVVVTPSITTTYSVTCSTASASATVTVSGSVPPTVTVSASPSAIYPGDSTTISWTSTGASTCSDMGTWTSSHATAGSQVVTPSSSASATTYTMRCSNAYGITSGSVTVTTYQPPAATVTAGSTSITTGSSTTITWSSSNTSSCTGTGFSTGSATSGTVTVTPSTTTTYTVTCSGTGPYSSTTTTSSDTVTVSTPALVASCSVSPTTAYIGQSTTWTAVASGGVGGYTYSWSGDDSLSGTGVTASKTYSSAGTKTASVTVTSGSQSSTVACSGGSGSVVVSACSATLSASPLSVTLGQSTTLTWSAPAACANACTFSDVGGSFSNSGTRSVTPSSGGTVTYGINSCTGGTYGPTGPAYADVTVNVPSVAVNVVPDRVVSPGSVTVTVTATEVTSCTVTKNGTTWQTATADGSNAVSVSYTDTPVTTQVKYAVSCATTAGGSNTVTDNSLVNLVPDFKEF